MFEARERFLSITTSIRQCALSNPCVTLWLGFFFQKFSIYQFLAKVGKRDNTPDTGKLRETSLNFTTFLEDVMYKCPIEPSFK